MVEVVEQRKGESVDEFFDRLARVVEEIHALKHITPFFIEPSLE